MAHETASLQQHIAPSLAGPALRAGHARRDLRNLASLTFLMSAHRMPVCVSMLLGDDNYLRQQLRLACTTADEPLQQLAIAMLRELAVAHPATTSINSWSH